MVNVRTRHLSSAQVARAMLWESLKLYYDPRAARRSRFFRDFPAFRGRMLLNNLALFAGAKPPLPLDAHALRRRPARAARRGRRLEDCDGSARELREETCGRPLAREASSGAAVGLQEESRVAPRAVVLLEAPLRGAVLGVGAHLQVVPEARAPLARVERRVESAAVRAPVGAEVDQHGTAVGALPAKRVLVACGVIVPGPGRAGRARQGGRQRDPDRQRAQRPSRPLRHRRIPRGDSDRCGARPQGAQRPGAAPRAPPDSIFASRRVYASRGPLRPSEAGRVGSALSDLLRWAVPWHRYRRRLRRRHRRPAHLATIPAIDGMRSNQECALLYDLARAAQDGCIVEIGTFHGKGTI